MTVNRREVMKLGGRNGGHHRPGVRSLRGGDLCQGTADVGAKETTSICCFCSVGCGLLVHTRDGEVINIEGDPEHPISEGSLCSKGSAVSGLVNNAESRSEATISCSWRDRMDRGRMGLGARPDRPPRQGHPGQHVQDHRDVEGARTGPRDVRQRRDAVSVDRHRHADGLRRQPDRRDSPCRQRRAGQ